MINHRLGGDIHLALSHLALVGLAAIVDDVGGEPSSLWWTEDQQPAPMLRTHLDLQQAAAVVHAHAARHTSDVSWISRIEQSGVRAGGRLFAARAKVPRAAEWAPSVQARRRARREHRGTPLDGRMIQGLGEAAWWRWSQNQNRPDQGASRWEMKTRNRGEEFLQHRLAPLAAAVSGRSVEDIPAGLEGAVVKDELGGTSPDSRTSTGLTTPGPADAAVAWCALWGLSAIPTIAQHDAVSRSPGMWPADRLHPQWAGLPVVTSPVTVSRYSQLLTSQAFDVVGKAYVSSGTQGVGSDAAQAWLVEQGVRAVVFFPVLKTGSASAPERQLLAGEVVVLA